MFTLPNPAENVNITIAQAGEILFNRWVDAFAARGSIDLEARPTAGPDFIPTLEDEAERLTLVAELEAREEVLAELALVARLEAMEAAFSDPWDMVSDGETIEARGYHPANAWE